MVVVKRKNIWRLLVLFLVWCLGSDSSMFAQEKLASQLTDEQAAQLAGLALKGLDQEYPNKPANVLAGPQDIRSPREFSPAFFGCFDWHSSVHGHWMLVRLLKVQPNFSRAQEIRDRLEQHLTLENILAETKHFQQPEHKSFERLYGWAWYLRLVTELHTWDDAQGQRWRANLKPLEDHLVAATLEFLPKQAYPIRTGVHPNTAFGMAQIRDYAIAVGHLALVELIDRRARDYFFEDRNYPIEYEPSGEDFFSGALNEADLMRRVLPSAEFEQWFENFLPQLERPSAERFLTPVSVTDITDGKLVHLAGLNFNRAWTLQGILASLPESSSARTRLELSAEEHIKAGMEYVFTGDYAGEHWLGTFAIYVLTNVSTESSK
jgi:hypothetical protein